MCQGDMFWLSLIPVGFKTAKSYRQKFLKKTVRLERKIRSSTDYHMREGEQIAPHHLARRFVAVSSWFHPIEVCQGFWSEMGPIVTYLASEVGNNIWYLLRLLDGIYC